MEGIHRTAAAVAEKNATTKKTLFVGSLWFFGKVMDKKGMYAVHACGKKDSSGF